MKTAVPITLMLLLLLAACADRPGNAPDRQGPPLPPDTPMVTDTADGLEIGHRLMAAGEYELALRAYYRSAAEQGTTVDLLSAVGSANLRLGRLGQAEQLLRRALERDQTFVPALNNLGVVLAEQGRWGEAHQYFHNAFAFDSGRSDQIRENLRLAIAKLEDSGYDRTEEAAFALVRRGTGQFVLLAAP